ncbi:GtrA family protein [Pseudomonas sp. DOAB1069]|uniref:GtrA family protein n=2 Tax=Pseudomonas TaxID=286 RepID=A0ABR7AWB7_9PSED|nr:MULTISPECIES: GtrA family protein [Pseudomonas]MBC3949219.1 GtrA family protein [Pseudomonas folii]
MSGGVNTAVTYLVYLLMLQMFSYAVAYSIAYGFGILLAFVLNRYFVFQSHRGAKAAILFPFIYLIQYLASLMIIWLWVEKLDLNAMLAPLASIILTIPITYSLSKLLFSPKKVERI